MLIVALVILAITRLDFGNLNSFHVLLLFLVFLLLMLRWGNMRREAVRKQAMERYKEEYEPEPANKSIFRWEDAPAETPVEKAAADLAVDSEPVPIETAEPAVSEETTEKPAE